MQVAKLRHDTLHIGVELRRFAPTSIAFPFHAFALVPSFSPPIHPLKSIVSSLSPFQSSIISFLSHLFFHLHLGQAYAE